MYYTSDKMGDIFNASEDKQIIDYTQTISQVKDFELETLEFLKKLIDFDQGIFVISESSHVTIRMANEHGVDPAMVKVYSDAYRRSTVSSSSGFQPFGRFAPGDVLVFDLDGDTDYAYHTRFDTIVRDVRHNRFFLINDNGDGIHLFRREEDKPFQDYEIARCRYLAPIIGNLYTQHLHFQEIRKDAGLFKIQLNSMYFGALIFDRHFSLIKANKPAIIRMSAITGKEMAAEMIEDFAQIIKTMLSEEKKVEKHLTIYKSVDNYIIELVESHEFDDLQNLNTHYVVFIYKKEWFSSMMTSSLDEVINQYDLTEREKQLVYLIVCGYSNSQIADELFISLYTVKEHIKSIFRKMNLNSRGDLIIKVYSERN